MNALKIRNSNDSMDSITNTQFHNTYENTPAQEVFFIIFNLKKNILKLGKFKHFTIIKLN